MGQKIWVIEDDENIAEIIMTTLASASYEVRRFDCGRAFFQREDDALPDLLLLDIMLPDQNGHEILKKIRADAYSAALPVIFLTAKGTEFDKAVGLGLGADDYIVKPFGVLEFLARIKAVLRRYEITRSESGRTASSGVQKFKELTIDAQSREVMLGDARIKLTHKEFELLMYLYNNRGIVIGRDSLLENVWGYDYAGDTRTVDMHIKSLRRKLEDNPENPQYIETIRGYGYKFLKD